MAGREQTFKHYNLDIYEPLDTDGMFDMPVIHKDLVVPERLIGFNEMLTAKSFDVGIHMFIDDYQFERLWTSPKRYMPRLRNFQCVFSPDFSLYLDMPMAMKVWNVYRSRLIGSYMQACGVHVIPTVSWAEPETYSFCFDGIEEGSICAVSTTGVMRSSVAKELWYSGMNAMIESIRPDIILAYGNRIDFE